MRKIASQGSPERKHGGKVKTRKEGRQDEKRKHRRGTGLTQGEMKRLKSRPENA
jgi:hypothetical protein